MTRGITGALLTALQAQVVYPIYFTKIQTTGSDLLLCSNYANFSWNALTWLGNGQLASSISGIHENEEAKATGIRVTLDCLDSSLMSVLLSSLNRSKKGSVYLGALSATDTIVVDPIQVYEGYFESVEINENSDGAQAIITYENEIIGLKKVNEFRYTHESQQAYFAGDLCFQYTSKLPDWTGFWGKAARPKRNTKRNKDKN